MDTLVWSPCLSINFLEDDQFWNWQGQTWANSCSLQKVWNWKENGSAQCHEFFNRNVARDGSLDIYVFCFFFKLQMRKSSTRDIPFTNLAKTKKRRASRIKVYLQCGELSPDNPTGRRRFPLIFFSFVLFFFFLRGKFLCIFFCWLILPFKHLHLKTPSNSPLYIKNEHKCKSFLSFHFRAFSPTAVQR